MTIKTFSFTQKFKNYITLKSLYSQKQFGHTYYCTIQKYFTYIFNMKGFHQYYLLSTVLHYYLLNSVPIALKLQILLSKTLQFLDKWSKSNIECRCRICTINDLHSKYYPNTLVFYTKVTIKCCKKWLAVSFSWVLNNYILL